ncbi:type II toxin-antitoxin system HicB family antitoxin [Candidatus Gottesmanbacteria bacterium]|nr:type II toxin-antitoxin system HicB family antitoxin [Candidatus Gottesmanbacteria bacterium]
MKDKIAKTVLRYTALFEPAEEGGFVVTVPKLPGVVTEGDTFEEAQEMAQDAIRGYIEVLQKDGEPIPAPDMSSFIAPIDVTVGQYSPIQA